MDRGGDIVGSGLGLIRWTTELDTASPGWRKDGAEHPRRRLKLVPWLRAGMSRDGRDTAGRGIEASNWHLDPSIIRSQLEGRSHSGLSLSFLIYPPARAKRGNDAPSQNG
jgi:hypothetical protein